jgi:hypothetical protein
MRVEAHQCTSLLLLQSKETNRCSHKRNASITGTTFRQRRVYRLLTCIPLLPSCCQTLARVGSDYWAPCNVTQFGRADRSGGEQVRGLAQRKYQVAALQRDQNLKPEICTLHSAPYTLHPRLWTLDSRPSV